VIQSKAKLEKLSTGDSGLINYFSEKLDEALQSRGEAPVALKASDLSIKAPEQREQTIWQGAQGSQITTFGNSQQQTQQAVAPAAAPAPAEEKSTGSSGSSAVLIVVLMVVGFASITGAVLFMQYKKNQAWNQDGQQWAQQSGGNMYQSKVAHLDQGYGGYDQNASWEHNGQQWENKDQQWSGEGQWQQEGQWQGQQQQQGGSWQQNQW
jgi:hypothetical protein